MGTPEFSPHLARNRVYRVFDRLFANHKRSGSRSQRWNEKHGLDRPEASIEALFAHPHLDRALQCVLAIRAGAFPFDRTGAPTKYVTDQGLVTRPRRDHVAVTRCHEGLRAPRNSTTGAFRPMAAPRCLLPPPRASNSVYTRRIARKVVVKGVYQVSTCLAPCGIGESLWRDARATPPSSAGWVARVVG